MELENYYKDIKHIIYVSTNIITGCDLCSCAVGGDNFSESINHYIKKHGYKLLHVGTETHNDDGNLWYSSVAILGK